MCYVCLVYGLKKIASICFFGTTIFPGEFVRMVLEPIPAYRQRQGATLDAYLWGELL